MATQSLYETLAPISGGCLLTAASTYPIDVVRALRMASAGGELQTTTQLLSRFVKVHGVSGLLSQGVLPEVVRATWMRVLQFFCLPIAHQQLTGKPISKGTPSSKAFSGVVATIPSVLTITPLENAKIALQLDEAGRFNNSMTNVIRHLASKNGLAGPFVGWQGVQLRQAVWFGTYLAILGPTETTTKRVLKDVPGGENVGKLVGGFIAGTVGAVFNTPFDLVRTNLQKEALARTNGAEPIPRREIMSMAFGISDYSRVGKEIISKNGVGVLYRGFGFKALHLGSTGACLAVFIPAFQRLLGINKDVM